jgi:hypothetical protein
MEGEMANTNYDRNRAKWEWGDGWESKGMTEKQYNYIVAMAEKANITLRETVKDLNRGGASGLIEELKRVANYGDSTRYLKRWANYVEV